MGMEGNYEYTRILTKCKKACTVPQTFWSMNQSDNQSQFPYNNQTNPQQNLFVSQYDTQPSYPQQPSDSPQAFSYNNQFGTQQQADYNQQPVSGTSMPIPPVSQSALQPTESPQMNQSQSQVYQPATPAPQSQDTPTPPVITPESSSSNRFSAVATFFKIIGIILLGLVLILTSIFVYIIINPDTQFSRSIADLPFVREYISLPNSPDEDVSSSSSSQPKPGNQLLGLEENQQANLTFATPGDSKTTTEVVAQVLPSVFSLTVSFENAGFVAAGTGYVVSQDGLIVTNKHVIADACSGNVIDFDIKAVSSEDATYDVDLLSVDPIYDLAILRVRDTDDTFTPLTFASPQNIQLGMEVLAIGNALGEFQNTVTKGIVSGVNRSLNTSLVDECSGQTVVADGLIQTDAAINQGNSGGPLFNASGQVIGMNTFGTQGAENIGLAVPSSIIVSSLSSYFENNIIVRPRVGIISQSITPIVTADNPWIPSDFGEILFTGNGNQTVQEGLAADIAGLETGDILLSLNGKELRASATNPAPLRSRLISLKPGQDITFSVLRVTGTEGEGYRYASNPEDITVTLGEISFELE